MSKLSKKIRRFLKNDPGDLIPFTGDYKNWAEALDDSEGYDSPVILERTKAALLKVKKGEALYERDSVLLPEPEYPFAVLAGLFRAALANHGKLSVMDFGGSLGSSYFQCRSWLRGLNHLEWLVIEQPAHVACGRQHFASDELYFFETLEDCLAQHRPTVLLLSSVLQYLPNPYAMLQRLLQCGVPWVILDRTAFCEGGRERLTVQTVPESIYPARYPAWFFDEGSFKAGASFNDYELIASFPGLDAAALENGQAYYKGFIYARRGR